MLKTIALARLILGGDMNIQAPPNLTPDGYELYLEAGINDWGGVSPLTPDFINPEAPWPTLQLLQEKSAQAGFELKARLPIYPEFIHQGDKYLPPSLIPIRRTTLRRRWVGKEQRTAAVSTSTPSLQYSIGFRVFPDDRCSHRRHRRGQARRGPRRFIDPADLTIVCNTGDDCIFHGLYISPDIDTIIYTLAGLNDAEKGWGIKGDTFAALEQLRRLGNDAWFNLGDKDLATHITRTRLLNEGRTLSEITDQIRRSLGVRSTILPMSDERVETRVRTPRRRNFFSGILCQRALGAGGSGGPLCRSGRQPAGAGSARRDSRRRSDHRLSEQPGHQYRPDSRCAGNSRSALKIAERR